MGMRDPLPPTIHATAIVDPGAELGAGVVVGPYCVVGRGVHVGRGTRLLSHAVLEGPAVLGEGNVVHPFAVLGGAPQHKRDGTAQGRLTVGDHNTFRESVTVHRGTSGNTTTLGHDNLFMALVHVAHDVRVGSHVTVANGVQLAGHVTVGDHATFGGLGGVAQFVVVGESAFVAAGAMCERDVPPFVIVQGDRARVRGLNVVGLRRRGVPEPSVRALRQAFRSIFGAQGNRAQALDTLDRTDAYVAALAEALESARRRSPPAR